MKSTGWALDMSVSWAKRENEARKKWTNHLCAQPTLGKTNGETEQRGGWVHQSVAGSEKGEFPYWLRTSREIPRFWPGSSFPTLNKRNEEMWRLRDSFSTALSQSSARIVATRTKNEYGFYWMRKGQSKNNIPSTHYWRRLPAFITV